MIVAKRVSFEPYETEAERMADAMLGLAETAMRACIDAGIGHALRARAERLLGEPVPTPAAQPTANCQLPTASPLTALELTQILGALKVARASRLTPSENAANVMARAIVQRALRGALETVEQAA